MSATKYTPGPWKVRPHDLGEHNTPMTSTLAGETWSHQNGAIVGRYTERHVCTVGWRSDKGVWGPIQDRDEAIANRHLIAAAPELLEALEEARDALHDIIGAADNDEPYTREELAAEFIKVYDQTIDAINKAKGITE